MISFRKWMENRRMDEMTGSVSSIVSCKNLKNKNFQIQGALSNLRCQRKNRIPKIR